MPVAGVDPLLVQKSAFCIQINFLNKERGTET